MTNDNECILLKETKAMKNEILSTHLNNTYEIVSKVGYLIGVEEKYFSNSDVGLESKWFNQLQQEKDSRIIRNLCILRTILFKKKKNIYSEICYNLKNLDTLPEYIPTHLLSEVSSDGLNIIHANWQVDQYLTFISSKIADMITGCKKWFPIWISWEYIRSLFIIPRVEDRLQLKTIWGYFTNHLNCYPYHMFIMCPLRNEGNILYNDEKFVKILYGMHGKKFTDINKLKDASDFTKENIYSFIEHSENIAVIVDCENADPFKLYSMLDRLESSNMEKIKKILLYNDIHTSTAWALLNRFTSLKVEHKMVERIKEDKSLLDMKLAVGACREYFQNAIESFILISSDSDYWGLITEMPQCRFLVIIEHEKTSPKMTQAMQEKEITYCYINDFCSGNLETIQSEALIIEIRAFLKKYEVSINDMMDKAMYNTRIEFSDKEMAQFKKRYISKFHLEIDDENISITI